MFGVQMILGSILCFLKMLSHLGETPNYRQCYWKKPNHLPFLSFILCIFSGKETDRHFYCLFQPYYHFFTGLRKTNCHLYAWLWPRIVRLCTALRISILIAYVCLQGAMSCSRSPWKALAPGSIRGRRTSEVVRMAEKPLPGTFSLSCIILSEQPAVQSQRCWAVWFMALESNSHFTSSKTDLGQLASWSTLIYIIDFSVMSLLI